MLEQLEHLQTERFPDWRINDLTICNRSTVVSAYLDNEATCSVCEVFVFWKEPLTNTNPSGSSSLSSQVDIQFGPIYGPF